MHQFLIIYKNNEGRWFHRYLRNIVKLQSLSFIRWWLLHRNCLRHDLIQDSGCNTECLVFYHHINHIIQLWKSLTGHCRYIHNLRIWHIGKYLTDLRLILSHGLIILLDRIPLIHDNDNSLAPFMGNSGYLCILLCYALCSINDHQHDVRTLYSTDGTDDTVSFQFLFDLIFSSQTCRINKYIFFSIMNNLCINRISCRSCNI